MASLLLCDDVACSVWNCCIAPLVVPCLCVRKTVQCVCGARALCVTPPDMRFLYLGHQEPLAPPPTAAPAEMQRNAEAAQLFVV